MFSLPPWLLFFPVLGVLILVHEAGHFVTAKWVGIRVLEFGIGFPPRMFGVTFRGTLYSVNWLLPFGGFVRFVGGEEDPTEPDSFARQSVAKRSIVLVAGSFMNLLLPVVIISILFMLPHDVLAGGDVIVTAVAPGSPAKEAGLRAGDTILSIDGMPVNTHTELVEEVGRNVGSPVELSIRRGATISGLTFSPELATYETLTLVPRRNPPSLEVVRDVEDLGTQVSLAEARLYDSRLGLGDSMTQGAIGVMIGLANVKIGRASDPLWTAVPNSFRTIWDVLVVTKDAFAEGLSTRSNPGVAGPIGIAQAAGEGVSRLGVAWIFQFTAILSISLAVVNMMPFPPLDGGRFAFVVLEVLRRGKRISPKREGMVHLVGFAIVIGFVLFMSYFDVLRILEGRSLLPFN